MIILHESFFLFFFFFCQTVKALRTGNDRLPVIWLRFKVTLRTRRRRDTIVFSSSVRGVYTLIYYCSEIIFKMLLFVHHSSSSRRTSLISIFKPPVDDEKKSVYVVILPHSDPAGPVPNVFVYIIVIFNGIIICGGDNTSNQPSCYKICFDEFSSVHTPPSSDLLLSTMQQYANAVAVV